MYGRTIRGFQEWRDTTTWEIIPEDTAKHRRVGCIKISYEYKEDFWPKYVGRVLKLVPFHYYVVFNKSSEKKTVIGRITEHTTEDRLRSMLYRFYNEGHAKPTGFIGFVNFTGTTSRTPYVVVPSRLAEAHDLRVDDEVQICITRPDGHTYTDRYHLSHMSLHYTDDGEGSRDGHRMLIVPLVAFKRLVVVNPGTASEKITYVKKTTYDEHTEKLRAGETIGLSRVVKNPEDGGTTTVVDPCIRFIDEGDEVKVDLYPDEYTQHAFMERTGRFDFAKETLNQIRLAKLRMGNGEPEDE